MSKSNQRETWASRTEIFFSSVSRANILYCIKTQLKMTTCAQHQFLPFKRFSQAASCLQRCRMFGVQVNWLNRDYQASPAVIPPWTMNFLIKDGRARC